MATVWHSLRRQRRLSRRSRRILLGILSVLVLLAGALYTTYEIQLARAVREAKKLTLLGGFEPPAQTIVCRTGPTPDCASEAARRMGLPTAWMLAPPGYRLQWLWVGAPPGRPADRRVAFENLVSERFLLELTTQPQTPPEYNTRLVGTYTIGGVAIRVFAPTDSTLSDLTLAWTHFGRLYTLWVAPLHLLERPTLDPQAYVKLVAAVQYAEP